MSREPERSLAKCKGFDVGIEDHGILVMHGHFDYDDGSGQGLGYSINSAFLYRFLSVFRVDRLQKVNDMSCWVTHTYSGITKIEPLHKKEGHPFDIEEWMEWSKTQPQLSAHELRTGEKR